MTADYETTERERVCMSKNTMEGKYRSYGENTKLLICLLIIMGAIFLILMFLDKIVHISSNLSIACWVLFLAFLAAVPFMLGMKAHFFADDYTVAFKEAFSREIRINYIEIDKIEVYNKMVSMYRRSGYVNRYVEVITFKTSDGEEYSFQSLMEIDPDSHVAAMLGADKLFEMGKFKILQRFIEQKQKNMYEQL
jgi:hypothetical protein